MKKTKSQKTKTINKRLALQNAYAHYKSTNDSIRKSAKLYSVPESTLRSWTCNPELLESYVGHPTLFTHAEEQHLALHVRKMALLGYGYARWQICELAQSMLQTKGLESITPNKDWYYGFIKRADLKIQKPKKRELSRVIGASPTHIKNYFNELESIMMKYNLMNKPAVIWNVDETGITLDFPPPKIACGKGEQPFFVSSSRQATTTVIAAGNALGETIPPYIIYKGQRLSNEMTTGCLPQTKFTMSKNGWSTAETFHDFIQNHFLTHVKYRPCILLYDGHSTHITLDVIERARNDDVHMFVLPPHSSHLAQPLDVGVFGPFKAALSSACHKLCHTEVGRQVTRTDLPSLIATAYKSAMTVNNLMSAFRKTGIVPFNSDILTNPIEDISIETTPRPKNRKQRKDVRNIKLLLNEIDTSVEHKLKLIPEAKTRQYIVPCHGAAVTEVEFIEKLKMKTQAQSKHPKSSTKQQKAKLVQKKRLSNETCCSSPDEISCTSPVIQCTTPEVIDSQEAGPSNENRKEWLTFYQSDSESGEEDDDAKCVICGQFTPPDFGKRGQLEILNWAKCERCFGWVHLKYCSLISRVNNCDEFNCSKCSV